MSAPPTQLTGYDEINSLNDRNKETKNNMNFSLLLSHQKNSLKVYFKKTTAEIHHFIS